MNNVEKEIVYHFKSREEFNDEDMRHLAKTLKSIHTLQNIILNFRE